MERKLTVNIENYVKRLKDIDFLQPLFEAIVNSLDADATNIKVKFDTEFDEDKKVNFVTGFSITDDGDGFNEKNTDTFFEMMQMDKQKGKLGSGRFIWLKVFDKVIINSKSSNKDTYINFVKNYDEISSQEKPANNETTSTTIVFSNVTKEYEDKKPVFDIEGLKIKIEYQLLPKLLLLKQKEKRTFNIVIGSEFNKITDENLPPMDEDDFNVKTSKGEADFKLFYKVTKDGKSINVGYYVAHGRQVKEFTKEAKLPNLPENASVIMFLTSKYFDNAVGDSRNELEIDMNNTTKAFPLSFSDINEKLKIHADEIINNAIPEIKASNERAKEQAIKEVPYLVSYIKSDVYGIRTKTGWQNYAKQKFEKDEKEVTAKFKKVLDGKDITTDEYERIVQEYKRVGEIELGRYIAYREQIIKHLRKLEKDSSTDEGKLHDVFITYIDKCKKEEGNKNQTFDCYTDANLWLLDDKFMFYKNVFSDEKIKNIKNIIMEEDAYYSENNTEPDITIFYDKKNDKKDVVVVEFKAIKINSSEAKHKATSIEQINTNIGIIKKEIEGINNFYGFIITKLDEKTIERLLINDAQKLYSNGEIPYFYLYNKNNASHTYIVDIRSIIQDASIRNKVFLDVLKGQT